MQNSGSRQNVKFGRCSSEELSSRDLKSVHSAMLIMIFWPRAISTADKYVSPFFSALKLSSTNHVYRSRTWLKPPRRWQSMKRSLSTWSTLGVCSTSQRVSNVISREVQATKMPCDRILDFLLLFFFRSDQILPLNPLHF